MLQDRLLFCRSTDVFCSSYTKPQVLSAQRKTPYPDFNITLAKNNSELKRPADVANMQETRNRWRLSNSKYHAKVYPHSFVTMNNNNINNSSLDGKTE